jgi:hypothetical protein
MNYASLAQAMLEEFRKSLAGRADQTGVTVELSKGAEEFAKFIDAYLKENPPSLIGHGAHYNYIITLVNQRQFTLAPDDGASGSDLPRSPWAPVLGARHDASDLPDSGAVPITGANR